MSLDDGVNATQEIKNKLHAIGDYAVAASVFVDVYPANTDPDAEQPPKAEKVLGSKGWYISSPVDGWTLHPLGEAT